MEKILTPFKFRYIPSIAIFQVLPSLCEESKLFSHVGESPPDITFAEIMYIYNWSLLYYKYQILYGFISELNTTDRSDLQIITGYKRAQ